jgi:NADH-quinone oxidoreductase subunit J
MVLLLFTLFATLTVLSGAMTMTARNPVHAVLFLILAFFNAAAIMLLAGAEFLAMLLVIVYVGAVAVLFLFVVMMLDVDFATLRAGFMRYLPLGAVIALVLLGEMVLLSSAYPRLRGDEAFPQNPHPGVTNTKALGQVLYSDYVLVFQAAGLVLLTAMIGAIVLTLRQRDGVKKQRIAQQVSRSRQESVVMISTVKPGEGVPH